jgi:DNA-binding transcriptional regulator/RsmH inhibitor MraZ
MSGPFNGYWENAVHNQRVIIPALFKRRFSEESQRTVVITAGFDNSIALYPLDNWYSTLAELAEGSDVEQDFRSMLIRCAVAEAELEGPGRVRLPERELRKAGITDRCGVKGDHHLISLWNPERFYLDLDNYEAEIRSRFDAKLWHKGRR